MAIDDNSCLLDVPERNKCYEILTSPQILKTFYSFQKLPTELREEIWKLVPDDRLIEVYWNAKQGRFMTLNTVPSIFQVCQESRHLALKTYKLMKFPVKMDYSNGVRFNWLVVDEDASGNYPWVEPPLPRPFEIMRSRMFSTYLDYSRDAIAISCIHHFKLKLDNRPFGPLFDFMVALYQSSKLQKQLRIAVCLDIIEDCMDEFINEDINLFPSLQELILISPQACCDNSCDGHHKIVDFEKQEWPEQPRLGDVSESAWFRDSSSTPYWKVLRSIYGNDFDQYWVDLKISGVKVVRKTRSNTNNL